MRIDSDQRLRPKAPARVDFVDLISDILGADLGERTSKVCIVRNKCAIQIKDIHGVYRSSKAQANWGPSTRYLTAATHPLRDGLPVSVEFEKKLGPVTITSQRTVRGGPRRALDN
jgi:hypothetical protein